MPEPKDHRAVTLECLEQRSILGEHLLEELVLSQNLAQGCTHSWVFGEADVVNALADDQKSKYVHDESNKVSQI